MISTITGKVSSIAEDSLVIEVSGLGFRIYVPRPMPVETRPGDQVLLHTNLVVREDSLTLYGFADIDQENLFRQLLGVNGVGPRLAMEILSTHTPHTIRRAVAGDQPELFQQVSGIGKKTAQKIILSLEDKITLREEFKEWESFSEMDAEVQEALVALGYSVVEAQTALQAIPDDAPEDLEERLRIALQNI